MRLSRSWRGPKGIADCILAGSRTQVRMQSMESLNEKIALVTGGTRGIGRAIAERLLGEGAQVAICGKSQESVDRAVSEMSGIGRIFGAAADISQPQQVRALFQAVDHEFGGLDILVNNAGQGR